MDVHVRRALTQNLQLKGVDVLTAQADGASELEDDQLLDRATELGRAVFTHDTDFLRVGAERRRAGAHFADIVFAHQVEVTIGQCMHDLEVIAKAGEAADADDEIIFLPL